MAKQVVIVVSSRASNQEAENAITKLLETKGWKVWHWFPELWLVSRVPDNATDHIREEIRAHVKHFMIFELPEGEVASSGYVPQAAYEWLTGNWISSSRLSPPSKGTRRGR